MQNTNDIEVIEIPFYSDQQPGVKSKLIGTRFRIVIKDIEQINYRMVDINKKQFEALKHFFQINK